MLPIRRLALVQGARALRMPTPARSSFHTSTRTLFPIPTSTDTMTSMDSKNTAGQGPNEKGSKGGKRDGLPAGQPVNPGGVPDPYNAPPSSREVPPNTPGSPSIDDVKEKVKKVGRQAKAKVQDATDSLGESARHTAASARVGASYVKEEAKHTVNTTKNKVKSAVRDADASSGASSTVSQLSHTDKQDGTAYTMSRPSSVFGSSDRVPETSGHVTSDHVSGLPPPTDILGSLRNVDTDAVRAKAQETASNVKAGLSSALDSLKSAASNVADSLKSTTAAATDKARDLKDNTGDRLASFGERMEAKFEKIGDNMMKSGEAIERRNQQPDPLPQPLPLDEVDHMPNPKDPNDVLPGTGAKDSKRNELADSRERGQFPG